MIFHTRNRELDFSYKRYFKYFASILIFSLLSLGLASCGGGDGGNSPETTAPQSTTVAEALESMDKSSEVPLLDRTPSIRGLDTDTNGVRDDIDLYIDTSNKNPIQKSAMRQLNRALISALDIQSGDDSGLSSTSSKMDEAITCIWRLFPPEEANDIVLQIEKMTVNTKSRFDAYMRYNSALSGSVVRLPSEVSCHD